MCALCWYLIQSGYVIPNSGCHRLGQYTGTGYIWIFWPHVFKVVSFFRVQEMSHQADPGGLHLYPGVEDFEDLVEAEVVSLEGEHTFCLIKHL